MEALIPIHPFARRVWLLRQEDPCCPRWRLWARLPEQRGARSQQGLFGAGLLGFVGTVRKDLGSRAICPAHH